MIIISYLYIGIDDTDSPEGMCTTYLADFIINKLDEHRINIAGYPRLIRLNPFARFKTRGNGAVSFKISKDNDLNLAKKIILNEVKNLSMLDCENTNPGVVFYEGEISKEMENYALKAVNSFITIDEAEDFAKEIGAEIYKFKKGRGIIGSIAAIGFNLFDYTYELLAYRIPENYGSKRQIDYDSVYKMNELTFPDTFDNVDLDEDYIAIVPKTPCPVLYGIRSNNVEVLDKAQKIVKVNEKINSSRIFLTNQHTDAHIQKASRIVDMKQFSSYEVEGIVENIPKVIEGGHLFFYIFDESGNIECGAYEPTKGFRKIVSKLLPGDYIKVYGGIGNEGTFNIEKFKVLKLNKIKFKNPICECGKTMSSAGKDKGFKCKKCGKKIDSNDKIPVFINRDLKEGAFYETPVSARRHLAKPLSRMKI